MRRRGWVLVEEIKASVAVDEVVNLGRGQRAHVLLKVFPKEGSVLSMIETPNHLFRWFWLDLDIHALPHSLKTQLARSSSHLTWFSL